jgi:hypothetical protein
MRSEPRRRVRRWVTRVAWILVATWALYLAAMNAFVRTRVFRNLVSSDATALQVDYSDAWSIVPGRIEVRDLHVRGRDHHLEWVLIVDRCSFTVGFGDLLRRRFHAEDVHGEGLSLRIRRRRSAFSPEQAAALPPIPGFSDPPYAGPPPPPVSDADYHLWSVWLERVVVDRVREVWIDTLRFTGDLRVTGEWFFRPLRWLSIGPASIEAQRLDASWGTSEAWVTHVTGNARLTVQSGDVRDYDVGGFFPHLSLASRLKGRAELAAVGNRALGGEPTFEGGGADFVAQIALDHGALLPGTTFQTSPTEVRARLDSLVIATSLDLEAEVDAKRFGTCRARAIDLRVTQSGVRRAEAREISAQIGSSELQLARPFGDASVSADVAGATADSIRFWLARFGATDSLRWSSGLATASAHGTWRLADRSGAFAGHVDVKRLEVTGHRGDGVRARADVAAEVRAQLALDSGRLDLTGTTVALRNMAATRPGAEPFLEGEARASLRAHLELGDGTASGEAEVRSRGLRIRAGSRVLDGDLDTVVEASRVGGTTALAGTRATFREAAGNGWWARLDAPTATLDARAGLRLHARVAVAAKDASPLTALLRSNADIAEKIALDLTSTSNLTGSAEVFVGPSRVEARAVRARGSGFDLNLEFAELHGSQIAALYMVTGPIAAGIGLGGGQTQVVLTDVAPWFATRVASIRAAEQQLDRRR